MSKKFWKRQAAETPPSFWEDMGTAFVKSAIDNMLGERNLEGPNTTAVRSLTAHSKALRAPVESGTRVSFRTSLSSVLSYEDVPSEGTHGTVVKVKTAHGKVTSLEDRVFVLWDDGKFRSILFEHLKLAPKNRRVASTVRMAASSLGDLSSLFRTASQDDELVHRATKDLWSFRQEGDQYVIERLFDETGEPLKV